MVLLNELIKEVNEAICDTHEHHYLIESFQTQHRQIILEQENKQHRKANESKSSLLRRISHLTENNALLEKLHRAKTAEYLCMIKTIGVVCQDFEKERLDLQSALTSAESLSPTVTSIKSSPLEN